MEPRQNFRRGGVNRAPPKTLGGGGSIEPPQNFGRGGGQYSHPKLWERGGQ